MPTRSSPVRIADGLGHPLGLLAGGGEHVQFALVRLQLTGPDRQWLDMCSGPGGKAALLGAIAAQRGATLIANERQPHRGVLVSNAVESLDNVSVLIADGTRPAWHEEMFDRVLVDAPCSGLGALRRRPESRWRRRPSDLADLVPLQRALLKSALGAVRSGGVVVYATCSPVLAETTEVVAAVTAERADVDLVDSWQLWPHRDGTDAMYAATLRKR